MNEWDLIRAIKKAVLTDPPAGDRLILGIGDDCAAFDIGGGRAGLVTTDISVEKVHFDRAYCGDADIGYRAMASNISDIAAMGGTALFAFVSLGIPDGAGEDMVLALYRGMREAAAGLPLRVAGGDLSRCGETVISIAIYGEAARDKIVTRKGAARGDRIYVTGTLGGSLAGMELLAANRGGKYPSLAAKHLRPDIRIGAVPEILERYRPTAMIDVSDGLLSDLRHVCEASNAGFLLEAGAIPVSPELAEYCGHAGRDPLRYALEGGEEYELLFTSPVDIEETVALPESGVAVTRIGRIEGSGYLLERGGRTEKAEIRGFQHFSAGGSS